MFLYFFVTRERMRSVEKKDLLKGVSKKGEKT